MRRKIAVVTFVILALCTTTLFTPELQAQSELDKWKNKYTQLQKEQNQIKAYEKQLERQIASKKGDINALTKEIKDLDAEIIKKQKEIEAKEEDIAKIEAQGMEVAKLLDEAIARVEARDEDLKKRVRAMYEVGEVSYLEVLLDSQSIGDFLTRMDMVEKIVESDKAILAENIADKEEIAKRKLELDAHLVQLHQEYDQLNFARAELKTILSHRTASIATLKTDIEELNKEMEEADKINAKLAAELAKAKEQISKLEFDGVLKWPVPSSTRITSKFGTRTDPITKVKSTHNGLDIGAPQGTTIVAAADGEVIMAKENGSYGYCVMISHGNGVVTLYAHIRKGGIMVKDGEKVERGQKIAEVGSTGRSTGPHLHFSVIESGVYKDPEKYLRSK